MADLWYDIIIRSSSSSSQSLIQSSSSSSSSSSESSSSLSSSSSSISQSSSSESSSCTQQFLDYTDPSNWEVSEVLGNPLAIWQPSASRWSSTTASGDDQVNLLPSAGTFLATAQPQQVRFTIQFKPGYSDLSISSLKITYNDGVSIPRPEALDTGTITLSSGNPQTFTYSMNTNGYPIQQVYWRDSEGTADAFWISNIEFWEDCGSSSSSSESTVSGPDPSGINIEPAHMIGEPTVVPLSTPSLSVPK